MSHKQKFLVWMNLLFALVVGFAISGSPLYVFCFLGLLFLHPRQTKEQRAQILGFRDYGQLFPGILSVGIVAAILLFLGLGHYPVTPLVLGVSLILAAEHMILKFKFPTADKANDEETT